MKYLFLIFLFLSILEAKIYRDNKKEVVIDDKHHLMWQDDISNIENLKNHKQATKFCKELIFATYDDWRLPTVEEYSFIVYKKNRKTNINFAFKYNLRDSYWASKVYWRTLWFYADYIYFVSGSAYYDNREKNKYVRCIRNIK